MNEGIEKQDDYESTLIGKDLAVDFLNDPEMHGHHHLTCLKDRAQFEDDLEALMEENVELLSRIEKLEETVKKLDSLINWDNVFDIVNKLEAEIPFA